jgi:hypothetical protein
MKLIPRRCRNYGGNLKAYCGLCGVDTGYNGLSEWYAVHDHVWRQAWISPPPSIESGLRCFLCIGCLEALLGRRLVNADFVDNNQYYQGMSSSRRLWDRVGSIGERP